MKSACALLTALLLAACSSSRGPDWEDPRGPRRSMIEDGVPAMECLLKPFATGGALTRDAMERGVRAGFDAADTDRNGMLTKAEAGALNAARAGSCDRSPVIDWSGGGVPYDDYAARYRTAFERADADGDGTVTAAEFAARPHRPPMRRRERDGGEYRGPETPS